MPRVCSKEEKGVCGGWVEHRQEAPRAKKPAKKVTFAGAGRRGTRKLAGGTAATACFGVTLTPRQRPRRGGQWGGALASRRRL